MKTTFSRGASFAVVAVAYACAAAVGWLAFQYASLLHITNPALALFVADLAATLVIFISSVLANNTSMYDSYWSTAPPLLAWQMLVLAAPGVPSARQILVMVLIIFWAVRLTFNFLRGWPGLHHEDWRFVDMRIQTRRAYWLVSLTALHLIPTAIVYLACWGLWPALATSTRPLNPWDGVAAVVGFCAVMLELVADEQLRRFRADPAHAGRAIDSGVWRTSRHPNYLGEIGFWWGVALFAFAAKPSWWVFGGAIVITAMFVFATIPLAEKRALARRPDYAARLASTRMLLPWPPR